MYKYDVLEKYKSHKKIIFRTGTVKRWVVEKQTLHSSCLETKLSFVSVDYQNNTYFYAVSYILIHEVTLHYGSVGVWCAMSASCKIGPFSSEKI